MSKVWADNWSEAEELSRDTLLCLTALLPDERVAGVALAIGLSATRGVLNTLYAAEQLAKLPFRVLGLIK